MTVVRGSVSPILTADLDPSASDNAEAFQYYIDKTLELGSGRLILPDPGTYRIGSTINVPLGIEIYSQRGAVLIPTANFTDEYMFLFNTLAPDDSGFIEQFPNIQSGGMRGVFFDNPDYESQAAGVKAIKFAGSMTFEELRFVKFDRAIEQDDAAYSDNVTIRKVFVRQPTDHSASWSIQLGGQGDGCTLSQIHFSQTGLDGNLFPDTVLGMNINRKQSCQVDGIIGGSHRFAACNKVDAEIYTEYGNVRCDSSNMTLNAHIYMRLGLFGVLCGAPLDGHFKLKLRDCRFNYGLNKGLIDSAEVKTHPSYDIEIDDCTRMTTTNGVSGSQHSGIRVVDSAGASIDDFNNHSYLNSMNAYISNTGGVTNGISLFNGGLGSFPGVASASPISIGGSIELWDIAYGTYYYRARWLLDPVREAGKNGGAEVSATITSSEDTIQLNVSFPPITGRGIVRVYRGTAPGSYTEFADIHAVSLDKLYDLGTTVNGITWLSRSAGGMDSNSVSPTKIELKGDIVSIWENGANEPLFGDWVAGDEIINTMPTVDGNNLILEKRICTLAGTPGTWAPVYSKTTSP